MADVNVAADQVGAAEVALTANTAKTVGFARDLSEVDVANMGGAAAVYVAFVDADHPKGATVPAANSPTHCFAVYPNSTATLPVRTDGDTLVSVISSAATTVWVSAT